MFGLITTSIEVLGAISISAGVGLCFGIGAALIAVGVLLLVGSYIATAPDGDN